MAVRPLLNFQSRGFQGAVHTKRKLRLPEGAEVNLVGSRSPNSVACIEACPEK